MGRGGRGGGRAGSVGGKRWVFLAAGQHRHDQRVYWNSETYYDQVDIYSTERLLLMVIVVILTTLSCACIGLRGQSRIFWHGQWICIVCDAGVVLVLMWLTNWISFLVTLCLFSGMALLTLLVVLSCCIYERRVKMRGVDTESDSSTLKSDTDVRPILSYYPTPNWEEEAEEDEQKRREHKT